MTYKQIQYGQYMIDAFNYDHRNFSIIYQYVKIFMNYES
jgi:hypothetical protein